MAPSGPMLRVAFPGLLGGKVARWLVPQGKQVSLNQPIAECDCDTDGGFPETLVVLSPGDGTLVKHLVAPGGSVPKRPIQPADQSDDGKIDGGSEHSFAFEFGLLAWMVLKQTWYLFWFVWRRPSTRLKCEFAYVGWNFVSKRTFEKGTMFVSTRS
jgi:hypothetical protein